MGSQFIASFPEQSSHLYVQKKSNFFFNHWKKPPPEWSQLQHPDITKQSEHLFQLNRQRDSARADKPSLLDTPIAFLWSGILRQYVPEYHGFAIALGPELTRSSWGIIRFKPINLPDYLVAIPSLALRQELLSRQEQGEQLEITVICIGVLTPDESLIYAFSHDNHKDGMILPVVSVQNMIYLLKPS